MNKKRLATFLLIFVICGIIGFIFETFFYRIDLGYFVKRGSTFGPWIPIYGFGGVFIYLFTSKVKNKPLLVFLISLLSCTILEFLTGIILYNCFHLRLWNYNEEILNFGNIGGYICLRSILLWGLAGLFLIYFIVPLLEKMVNKKERISFIISLILSIVFIIDIMVFWIVLKA